MNTALEAAVDGHGVSLGQLMAGVAYLVVGVRLSRLAMRTGERPEMRLGSYFLLTGMDYGLYTVPVVFGIDSVFIVCAATARVSYAVAVTALVMFTREVFRPNEIWARWLAWLCASSMFGAIVAGYAVGDWVGETPNGVTYWPYFAGYFSACVWVTTEALLAYSGARKRRAIGLCEPIVANRYLLFGSFGAFQVLACFGVVIVDLQAMGGNGTVSNWADLSLTALEVGSIAMLWLAFFPPALYRDWLGGRAEPDAAAAHQEAG